MLSANQIKLDEKNPRMMTEQERKALRESILEFGNISEIVFNKKSGRLVGGNHRWEEILDIHGKETISLKPIKGTDLYLINSNNDFTGYVLREVDWDEDKASVANIVANSDKVTGSFTIDINKIIDKASISLGEDFISKIRVNELKFKVPKVEIKKIVVQKQMEVDHVSSSNIEHNETVFEDDDSGLFDIDETFDFGGSESDFELEGVDENLPEPKPTIEIMCVIENNKDIDKVELHEAVVKFLATKKLKISSVSVL